MIASATRAHWGLFVLNVKYDFSHIRSIASFLDLMSNRPLPPMLMGAYRVSALIGGLDLSPYIKILALLSNFFSTAAGIPCTWVRYWVIPPTVI